MKILRIPLVIVLVVLVGRAFDANARTETILYSFGSQPNDGYYPQAGLVQGSDGNFYGTTFFGGANGGGTVFRISPSGSYRSLYSFGSSPADGGEPSGLVQGSDGNFYGTSDGGTYGLGTVFRISPIGIETILYSFGTFNGDGYYPSGTGLVQGSDSNFYGLTYFGGTYGLGTVFRISPSGSYTILYSFGSQPNDGQNPNTGPIQGNDGNLYGATVRGGTYGLGTVFRISPIGIETILYSFGSSLNDGIYPVSELVQGSDGNFYGTTKAGGTSTDCDGGCGTVFRISPSGVETILYSLGSSPTDGQHPGGLVQGSDGNFYGMTFAGGMYGQGFTNDSDVGYGTLFRISPGGSYTNLHSFGSSPTDGQHPGGLLQGSDGNFYGTTGYGGANGDGTVFKLDVGLGPINTNCTYTLSATSVTLTAKGGAKTVSVKAKGTGCEWTAVSNDPFIRITSGGSGTGNGKVDFAVDGNTNTTALSGTMTIADQTVTVDQAAGGCTFKLSPKTGKIKAAGGSATVKVTPNFGDCAWTAVSNDSFITITDGGSGVGKGSISYTVAANANTTTLTGSITIGGQTFTVTQSGEK
jgi:uncharacterized repeat protein (TIGR03803 family)